MGIACRDLRVIPRNRAVQAASCLSLMTNLFLDYFTWWSDTSCTHSYTDGTAESAKTTTACISLWLNWMCHTFMRCGFFYWRQLMALATNYESFFKILFTWIVLLRWLILYIRVLDVSRYAVRGARTDNEWAEVVLIRYPLTYPRTRYADGVRNFGSLLSECSAVLQGRAFFIAVPFRPQLVDLIFLKGPHGSVKSKVSVSQRE